MIYPEFNTDLLITVENLIPKEYIIEVILKHIKEDLKIDIQSSEKKNGRSSEWVSSSSFVNLYINNSFLLNHYITSSNDYKIFLDQLKTLITPLTKVTSGISKEGNSKSKRPLALFSAFYKTEDNYILHFLFSINGNEDVYINALKSAFELIISYSQKDSEFNSAIKNNYYSNNIKYLIYNQENWNVIDVLSKIEEEINDRYRSTEFDFRVNKPTVLIHKENFERYLILENNWVLQFDKLETMMIKPNDVTIYSNISDKNYIEAKNFYDQHILPRFKHHGGTFPTAEDQAEYYNYFELIISSLIFAYTSLEALANICIPYDFEYQIEKDGIKTIYLKVAIERKFPLRDKFKIILREILKTSDPTKEIWWSYFITLEDIRNEIIHTKQSKSENRYSMLLENKIFEVIKIHKEIIKYYGFYISINKESLLEDFPYNFGYDQLYLGLIDDKTFNTIYKSLHNIPD